MKLFKLGLLVCLVKCICSQGGLNYPCRVEHGTCTRDEYEFKRVVALVSSGCHKFCQCAYASTELDGSVTYHWVEKDCPDGLLFDDSLPSPVCNTAKNVRCGVTLLESEDQDCVREHGACDEDQYSYYRLRPLKSSGCREFCQCARASTEPNGLITNRWMKLACPPKTLFDGRVRACSWAPLTLC